mgnify:FL=1
MSVLTTATRRQIQFSITTSATHHEVATAVVVVATAWVSSRAWVEDVAHSLTFSVMVT